MRGGRPQVWALAVALAAGANVGSLSPRAARGEEPLAVPAPTDDVVWHVGLPPYRPAESARSSPHALAEWVERVAARARSETQARRAAELLYSAASAADAPGTGRSSARRRAGELYAEAQAAAPADDPLRALSALARLRIALDVGELEPARALAAWLDERARWSPPINADPLAQQREAALRWDLGTQGQLDIAALDAATGRLAQAAERLVTLADTAPRGWRISASELLERAALYHLRGRDVEAAGRTAQRASGLAREPEEQARLAFWLLHLSHGLLSEEGAFVPSRTRPGPTFVADLDAALRGLPDNPHVLPYLLSSASSALLAGDDETALAVYQRVLRQPFLSELLAQRPSLGDALLAGVPAALRRQRFEDADELLLAVARMGRATPLLAALRLQVALAREEAREAQATRPKAPESQPSPADRPPLEPGSRGTLHLAGPSDRPAQQPTQPSAPPDDEGPDTDWVWTALGALGLLAAGGAWLRRRRSRAVP